MPEKSATICNDLGLHARAAAAFVRLSTTFDSDIHVVCRDMEVDGKSIMGVMMLAASKGAELTVRAEGPDEDQALAQLTQLIASKFGEAK